MSRLKLCEVHNTALDPISDKCIYCQEKPVWPQVTPTQSDSEALTYAGICDLTELHKLINALHSTAVTICLTLLGSSRLNTGIEITAQELVAIFASFAKLQETMDSLRSVAITAKAQSELSRKMSVAITGEPTNKL